MPTERQIVAAIVAADVGGCWGAVDPSAVVVESGAELTEWHHVSFLTAPGGRKLVANVCAWRGATLRNKEAASRHLAALGLAPAVLAELQLEGPSASEPPLPLHVGEFIEGGILTQEDLSEEAGMTALGSLYARLHAAPTGWFAQVQPALVAEGVLPAGDEAAAWAGCLWVMPWLQRQVPEETKASLAAQGVDWGFLEREIAALPSLDLLPQTPTATVHGDIHEANLVWTSADKAERQLRMIDFDMTAVGPAGSDLGFLALALFRCAFSLDPALVHSRESQRQFARAYLWKPGQPQPEDAACDELLLLAHLWSYVAMIKIGLICGVLMERPGHAAKREIMRARGPVLLHPRFLEACKGAMREASAADGPVRQSVLSKGLFFHVDATAWRG